MSRIDGLCDRVVRDASALVACVLVLLVGGAPFRFPDRVVAIGSYLAS